MSIILAQSKSAVEAFALVTSLQATFVARLEALDPSLPSDSRFRAIDWLRAGGSFGGGNRYATAGDDIFNRASVNISQVQYESDPNKKLNSATALSTIIHPRNPHAPSMHMHISWTEMKDGSGYWRIMADLNPGIPRADQTQKFEEALRQGIGSSQLFEQGKAQGERYFFIPALERHRGVAHFYLEDYRGADPASDLALARRFGETVIETYSNLVKEVLAEQAEINDEHHEKQRHYHSLYFLQVLTLDRGTTSGLLVHNENDTGILGSLPSAVDVEVLKGWQARLPQLQGILLQRIIECLGPEKIATVDDAVKVKIAAVSRKFYLEFPGAIELLARGDVVPPTEQNHK